MCREGIQSVNLCKTRCDTGDKPNIAAENKLTEIYGTKYCIRLDHEILTDHGVFYPQALYGDLVFELTLAGADKVVKGMDPTKLTNIQLEYEMIHSPNLAHEADREYLSGKAFAYDHVH